MIDRHINLRENDDLPLWLDSACHKEEAAIF